MNSVLSSPVSLLFLFHPSLSLTHTHTPPCDGPLMCLAVVAVASAWLLLNDILLSAMCTDSTCFISSTLKQPIDCSPVSPSAVCPSCALSTQHDTQGTKMRILTLVMHHDLKKKRKKGIPTNANQSVHGSVDVKNWL